MKTAISITLAVIALLLIPHREAIAQNPQPCASVQNSAQAGQVLSAKTNGRTPACQWISAKGTGSVTSITATLPIVVTPSPLTSTGVISCPTCGAGGSSISQGTFAALPGTCTVGDLYLFTDSYYEQARCSSTNTFSYFLRGHSAALPPACASWTVVNVATGTAACSNSRGAIVLSTAAAVTSGYESALLATPAAPYVRTFALSFFNATNSSSTVGATCGIGYTDGTANTNKIQGIFVFTNAVGAGTFLTFRVWNMTAYDQSGSSNDIIDYPISVDGSLLYLQLEDNNTTKFFRVSTDGVNFTTIFSTARATNFTPTNYGIFCSGGTSGTLPWSITALSLNSGAQ